MSPNYIRSAPPLAQERSLQLNYSTSRINGPIPSRAEQLIVLCFTFGLPATQLGLSGYLRVITSTGRNPSWETAWAPSHLLRLLPTQFTVE